MYTKKDFWFSVVSGVFTGVLVWRLLEFWQLDFLEGFSLVSLVMMVPILWIIGVKLGFWLARWFVFFAQFGKFAAVGFTNAAVDLAVLNFLIAQTGIALGVWYAVFKGAAFIVAVIQSFFWNKYWTFNAASSHGGGVEFAKFIGVNLVGLGINVGVATLVANGIDPVAGLSDTIWANVGAVAGSASGLVWNFVGSKLIVFKGSQQRPINS